MNIGVLASHEGTTFQEILDACADGRIAARISVVISNNSASGALVRARRAGVPTFHLSSQTHGSELDAAIQDALIGAKVDLVFLGGYMKKLGPLTLQAFAGRILNTHPALLPKFGGPGMYGDRVFEATLAAGETESGVSIHLVNADYDSGSIIRQCRVAVLPGDSIEMLKARVRACERKFVVDTLAEIASGEIILPSAARHRIG